MDGHVSTISLIERAIKVINTPKVIENNELIDVKKEIERTIRNRKCSAYIWIFYWPRYDRLCYL